MLNLVVRKVHYAAYHFITHSNTIINLESILWRSSLVLPVFQETSPEVSPPKFCTQFSPIRKSFPISTFLAVLRFVIPLLSPKLKLPFFAVYDYAFNIFAPTQTSFGVLTRGTQKLGSNPGRKNPAYFDMRHSNHERGNNSQVINNRCIPTVKVTKEEPLPLFTTISARWEYCITFLALVHALTHLNISYP